MVPLVYVPRVCFILLQVLMQATQGYTFSGKQSSIDFLIMKSRGKARMLPCSLTAIGGRGRARIHRV